MTCRNIKTWNAWIRMLLAEQARIFTLDEMFLLCMQARMIREAILKDVLRASEKLGLSYET